MDEVAVRWYRPGDETAYLDLYRRVFDVERGVDWFDWKYERNPYVDHVPIVVATHGGELVGARSFFALEVRLGGRRTPVLQPCDTMVHPEYRRRGLFVRMTERAIGRYESAQSPLFFNFPNDKTLPGNLKLGWRSVGTVPTYYRIERPGRVIRSMVDDRLAPIATLVGEPLIAGYNALRNRTGNEPADVSVRRFSTVPSTRLASVYRTAIPDAIHAVRDETFYDWRFGNPCWKYTTYVATNGTTPAAGIVVGESVDTEPRLVRLTDVVPLCCDRRTAETAALIARVLSEHSDCGLFAATECGIGASTLRSFGFHSDDSPPLSLLHTPTNHVVRPQTDASGNELGLTQPANWCLTFAEQDTS